MQTEIEALKLRVAALEARLSIIEGAAPQTTHAPVQIERSSAPNAISEAISNHMHKMHGRLSTKDIAAISGINTNDHANLVRIGIALSEMGVKKVRTASGNVFVFGEPERNEPDAPMDRVEPVSWLRGAVAHRNAKLAGLMTGSDILTAIGLKGANHCLHRVYRAMDLLAVNEVFRSTEGERTFDFGAGKTF